MLKKAGLFFASAILQFEVEEGPSPPSPSPEALTGMLSQRTVFLAAANLALKKEVAQRKKVERALRAKEHAATQVHEKSAQLQRQLRSLSRRVITAQEDELKKISRELHDVIGQTLLGINLHLATLKKEARCGSKSLVRNIGRTQRLVEKSADLVGNFARELRPTVLDDFGLIPALLASIETFSARTGLRVHLTASSEIEKLDAPRRTALFRVAQEAMVNVGRHAEATRVDITIECTSKEACLTIADNGKSFDVEKALQGRGRKGLGLVGMRERVEMVGGRLHLESSPGEGTTIQAHVPKREPMKK